MALKVRKSPMKEYRITFYDIREAAQFVEYLEKSDLNGTLRYKGKVSDARSFMGILSFGFIGKPLVLANPFIWTSMLWGHTGLSLFIRDNVWHKKRIRRES